MKRWAAPAVLALATAATAHAVTLWSIPRLIETRTASTLIKRAGGINRAHMASLPTAASRVVVKPNPDTLFAYCVYDVSKGPILLSGSMPRTYWSVSGFAADTNNFFVIGSAAVPDGHFHVILAGAAAPERSAAIRAPSNRGVILLRVLVGAGDEAEAIKAQRSFACTPAS